MAKPLSSCQETIRQWATNAANWKSSQISLKEGDEWAVYEEIVFNLISSKGEFLKHYEMGQQRSKYAKKEEKRRKL